MNFNPRTGAPDRIYATMTIFGVDDLYTVNIYYGGNDDRIHFLNFQKGSNRMEAVLFDDAARPTATDPAPSGAFTLEHLLGSPRIGLGALGTVTWAEEDLRPDTRRAILTIRMGMGEEVDILAPFLEASSVSGYWIPLEGPHAQFVPADFFNLYGGTIGAGFWLLPESPGSETKEIVAISASDFFGTVNFCGFPVRIGDYADELLQKIEDVGYPCDLIVNRSENREFIVAMTDMTAETGQMQLTVTNNMIDSVFKWLR
jgi:hypothetical protein